MPTEDELEMILDRRDAMNRRDRTLRWASAMEPTPETDDADDAEETERG